MASFIAHRSSAHELTCGLSRNMASFIAQNRKAGVIGCRGSSLFPGTEQAGVDLGTNNHQLKTEPLISRQPLLNLLNTVGTTENEYLLILLLRIKY